MRKMALLCASAALASGYAGASAKAAPAPAPAPRADVTERGPALLALIAEAGDDGLMLTQDEGLEAVNAGHATVDTSVVEGSTAKVTLTEAGIAALSAANAPAVSSASTFAVDDAVPMPSETKRRGRTGGYPFDKLTIADGAPFGQSFHVPVGTKDGVAETADDVATRLQSSVSGARARFSEEIPGETESVTVKDYQKDADGKFVKDADGKRIVTGSHTETRPKTRMTRDFKVMAVDASDPNGPGARVWRIALA